jgi:adenylate cyclase
VRIGTRLRGLDTPLARSLLLGLAVSVAITMLSRLGGLAGWETRAIDAFLFFRDRVPTPEIVLVHIDEAAFQELGERQPLSRRYLAELAEFLLASGARVVGFDVQVKRASSPEEDGALVAVSRRWQGDGGRLVFTTVATPAGEWPSIGYTATPAFSPELRALVGFANAPLGGDGLVRTLLPVLPAAGGGQLPSFALAVLAGYASYSGESLARTLADGGGPGPVLPVGDPRKGVTGQEPVALKTLREANWRIDYVGRPGAFAAFPSGALVKLARSGVRPDADNPFRGKIVLVGATFAESRDFYGTPMGLMSGVEIQANMVHTLLSRRALLPPPWALNLTLLAVGCLWISVLSTRLGRLWVIGLSLALIAAMAALSYEAYGRGYWLDFIAPVAAMKLYRQGSDHLARRRLTAAFGQYVSKEVLERVLRDGARLGGDVRTVSVLMSDVRGFTTLAERLAPAQISETMNEYFTAMVDVILAHRGMVNDFIGDGILAVYGAPVDDAEHAWHAVETAIEMQTALRGLNARWELEGRPRLAMGVAVNTGEVFAGNMGAPRKKKYSVLGDTVNSVARIEGLNGELGTEILISGATLASVRDRVQVKDRGAVRVKGKVQAIDIFEVVDRTA